MLSINIWTIFVAALFPMVLGFIWYHPKVMGSAWMAETGVTEEKAQNTNMKVVFALSYIFSCMLAYMLMNISCHQMGILQLFASQEGFGQEGSEVMNQYNAILAQVGGRHLHFGHGVLHGVITGVFFVLPVLATNAMFELKSWKYIWINVGYWIICCALMAGFVCQFGVTVG